MKDVYTYKIGENLYLSLTNRCSNRCTFCVRDESAEYEGYPLWLKGGEPTAEQVIAEIGDAKQYKEIVFCGYGEPTYRLKDMLRIAEYVHACGGKTRLNTNGHGNAINGRNIAPELKGAIDLVNVSLNAPDKARYETLCRPLKGKVSFDEMIAFARALKAEGVPCRFSVVDCIGAVQVEECRGIAEKEEIPLYVREMITA